MISWLLSPLPGWARAILWVIIFAAIVVACVLWVFPYIQTFIPQPEADVTVALAGG